MSEILLLRHGETLWNIEGRIQGHGDSPLSAEGLAQADALARRLAAERPDALYTSDLGRARQTMEPIARATGLAPRIDPDLRERCYGVFEGRTWPEIERDFPQEYAQHLGGSPQVRAQGGESMLEFHDRAVGALTRIAERAAGGKVVIVAHGGVLGMLYRHIASIPLEAPRTYAMPNASINRFSFKSGIWCLVAWGDLSHLDHTVPEEFSDSVDSRFR
jgi:2,3-bisphosphoglycerate-dependent phosphoglycerate mutase